jgi:hypothetical protein
MEQFRVRRLARLAAIAGRETCELAAAGTSTVILAWLPLSWSGRISPRGPGCLDGCFPDEAAASAGVTAPRVPRGSSSAASRSLSVASHSATAELCTCVRLLRAQGRESDQARAAASCHRCFASQSDARASRRARDERLEPGSTSRSAGRDAAVRRPQREPWFSSISRAGLATAHATAHRGEAVARARFSRAGPTGPCDPVGRRPRGSCGIGVAVATVRPRPGRSSPPTRRQTGE